MATLRRALWVGGAGATVCAASVCAFDSETRKATVTSARALPRTLTAASAAARTAADYKMTLFMTNPSTEGRHNALQRCHERGAERIANACNTNRGVYIKLGQIAQLGPHIFPRQYITRLRGMLDQAPQSDWPSVKKTLEEDLGASVDEVFDDFSHTPIASASLAQVHSAVEKHSRQRLAVKVQHRGLQEIADSDIAAISVLVRVASYLGVDYSWLVNEMKENLPLELDFRAEAQNARECSEYFQHLGGSLSRQVRVPMIYEQLSSSRILTMERVDGVSPSDKNGLIAHGLDYHETARLVAQAFASLIFRRGILHADPHQANLFVRPISEHRSTKPQLVLIDHGLYRNAQKFRDAWSLLWLSLVSSDPAGIETACKELGAKDYQLFTSMITTRSWERFKSATGRVERVQRIRGAVSEEEQLEAQQLAKEKSGEIQDLLASLPRELLLVLKCNDNLRSVDYALSTPGASTFAFAHEAVRRLHESHKLSLFMYYLQELRLYFASFVVNMTAAVQLFQPMQL